MDLSAIQIGKSAAQRTAEDTAKRAVSHANSGLAFRKVSATTQAAVVAKVRENHAPVKPVALGTPAQAPTAVPGDLTAVLKAMTDGINKAVAAIRGPVQKAAPAVPPALAPAAAPASTLNVMLRSEAKRDRVTKLAEAAAQEPAPARIPSVEAERRREAEGRERARKAAAQADAERVQVKKAGGRVRVLKVLDPSLSDAALMALSHIVTKCEASGQQSMPIDGADLGRALHIPLTAAQAGYAELVSKGHVTSAKSPLGITHVTPSRAAAGL